MQPTKFDDLTKALAGSTSRRHALRTIVTASAGSLVGLGGISVAFGKKIKCGGNTSNSDCAHWCAAVFGANTKAASQCTSDAAHGRGLCCQCGSADPSSICCVRNNKGFCNGTAGATCCAANQTCQNGTCGADLCPSGGDCVNGFPDCSSDPNCNCGTTTEGTGACLQNDVCINFSSCTTSADCPAGSLCFTNNGCTSCTTNFGVCIPLCTGSASTSFRQRAPSGSGPTVTGLPVR